MKERKKIKRTPWRVTLAWKSIQSHFEDLSNLPESMEYLGKGIVASYLSEEEYDRQMGFTDQVWMDPITKEDAVWDDDWYENVYGAEGYVSTDMLDALGFVIIKKDAG